jgi:hypothetical protein
VAKINILPFRESNPDYRANSLATIDITARSSYDFRFVVICEYGELRCNDVVRGKPKESEKSLPQSHFVHYMWTVPGANLGLRSVRPVTNRLSHGTAKQMGRK